MGRVQVIVPYETRVLRFSLRDGLRLVNFYDDRLTETTVAIIDGPDLPDWPGSGHFAEPCPAPQNLVEQKS